MSTYFDLPDLPIISHSRLSIALLQVQGIAPWGLVKATVSLACLFGIAGLATSGMYLALHSSLSKNVKIRDKWVEVYNPEPYIYSSTHLTSLLKQASCSEKHVEFWLCLALPVSSTVW